MQVKFLYYLTITPTFMVIAFNDAYRSVMCSKSASSHSLHSAELAATRFTLTQEGS